MSEWLIKLVAAWIMTSLIAINCTYTKVTTSLQKGLTLTKVFAFAIIIVTGFIMLSTDSGQDHLQSFTKETTTDVGSIALALFAGFYGYGGWQIITILAEEVKTPEKVIPRALGSTFIILTIANVSTNFAYLIVLYKHEAIESDAIAITFGRTIHPMVSIVLAILIVFCSIGSLNVGIMGQPRVMYAAGLNGHMPRMMTLLHTKFKTPWPATFFVFLLALITLSQGTVMTLVDRISLFAGIMVFGMMTSVLVLRWREPDIPRPLKVPIALPIFCLFLTFSLMVITIMKKPKELGTMILILLGGIPAYFIFVKWKKTYRINTYIDNFTKYLQILLSLSYPES